MDTIGQIRDLLKAGKKKNWDVIQRLFESLPPNEQALVKGWIDDWPTETAEPRESTSTWIMQILKDPKTIVGGVGVAGMASLTWIQSLLSWLQTAVHLPEVTNAFILLPIVAGLGALAGAAYSIYCNRGIVLPSLGKQQGVLTLTRFGILNEVSFGAMAAVTTIWLTTIGLGIPQALPGIPANPTAPAGSPAAVDTVGAVAGQKPNLLSHSVILGALVSGWLGARMRSARLDQALLTKALAKTATQEPMTSEIAEKISLAPSAAAAATLATGMNVIGTRISPAPVPGGKSELNARLFQLLDEELVRDTAKTSGPLKSDGSWLTLSQLKSLNMFRAFVPAAIGELKLIEVAAMTSEVFSNKAREQKLEPTQNVAIIAKLYNDATEVAGILSQQSANWSWST